MLPKTPLIDRRGERQMDRKALPAPDATAMPRVRPGLERGGRRVRLKLGKEIAQLRRDTGHALVALKTGGDVDPLRGRRVVGRIELAEPRDLLRDGVEVHLFAAAHRPP